jgi:hypothetical protein
VAISELKKFQKRIKKDYQLALDLYDTGNYDAMYLAGLIADDARMTRKDLQRWVEKAYGADVAALLPLNILPPNTAMPLTVYFPPDIPFDAKPQVQILTAIRLLPNDARYIPAAINNTLVQVSADGHSAQVNGQVLSLSQTSVANQVWVAVTAYDEDGSVVGVRRWESSASLNPNASLSFELLISSIGGKIARVEFVVEARP